jgi:hypothetical protein
MEGNGLACMETKKSYLNDYFLHNYMIAPTSIQLGSLETLYDTYLYKSC